jgi:hypothetical protein
MENLAPFIMGIIQTPRCPQTQRLEHPWLEFFHFGIDILYKLQLVMGKRV